MSEGDSMSLLSLGTGPQTETYAAEIVLPTCSIVTPAAISEEGYAEVISQVRRAPVCRKRNERKRSIRISLNSPCALPLFFFLLFLSLTARYTERFREGAEEAAGGRSRGDRGGVPQLPSAHAR